MPPPPKRAIDRPSWPVAAWLLGLLVAFAPTWSTGFATVQGGLGDSRLVNFTLEHGFCWLTGRPLAADLWSPPIFWPAEGVAAFTDLMLGLAPLYWPWRLLGAGPHTAYQLWLLGCWSASFAAGYLLLRRGLRVSAAAAAGGAWLFAFGNPTLSNIVHPQRAVLAFLALGVLAAVEMVRCLDEPAGSRRHWPWVALLVSSALAQLATAVYPMFFALIAGLAVLAAASATTAGRRTLAMLARRQGASLVVVGTVGGLLAAPIIARYAAAAELVGDRPFVADVSPRVLSWLLPGDHNLLYGWLHDLPELAWAAATPHHNGIGLVTMAACGWGLWRGRRRRLVVLTAAAVAALAAITLVGPGDLSLWLIVRRVLPGAAALRALGRVGVVILFPAALGLAIAVDSVIDRRRWPLLALLLVLVAAEQLQRPWVYDKADTERRIAAIASRVPRDAQAFLLVTSGPHGDPRAHDDAAWVALSIGVPTVNGRYGNRPPGWQLRQVHVGSPADRARIADRLEGWLERHGIERDRVAWVEIAARSPSDW